MAETLPASRFSEKKNFLNFDAKWNNDNTNRDNFRDFMLSIFYGRVSCKFMHVTTYFTGVGKLRLFEHSDKLYTYRYFFIYFCCKV